MLSRSVSVDLGENVDFEVLTSGRDAVDAALGTDNVLIVELDYEDWDLVSVVADAEDEVDPRGGAEAPDDGDDPWSLVATSEGTEEDLDLVDEDLYEDDSDDDSENDDAATGGWDIDSAASLQVDGESEPG